MLLNILFFQKIKYEYIFPFFYSYFLPKFWPIHTHFFLSLSFKMNRILRDKNKTLQNKRKDKAKNIISKLDKTRQEKNERASIAVTRIRDQPICTLKISMKVFIWKLSYIFRGYGIGQFRPAIATYLSVSSYELCSLDLAGLALLMFSIPSVPLTPASSTLCFMSSEVGEYLMGISP